VAFTFPDTNATPTDLIKLGLTYADINLSLSDLLLQLGLGATDTIALPTDAAALGLQGFGDSNTVPTDATTLNLQGFGDTNVLPTDAAALNVKGLGDTNAVPNDAGTYALNLAQADTSAAPTDTASLNLTGYGDTNPTPTEARSSVAQFFLSASSGTSHVTNPANANGKNDGTSSTQQTAVAGAATETLTSSCGVGIGAATTFTTAIYRGWFNATVTLATSTVKIVLHSTSALFTDKTALSITASANHNTGDFTYDLVANGIDTLAKLQSVQVLHSTTDAIAGTSPAVLTVDAGCIELAGVI
jgi:hypothetical protein